MRKLLLLGLILAPLTYADCINCASIPKPVVGYSEERLRPISVPPEPSSDGVAAVRTVCTPSHWNFDDPLVFPNQPGKAHLHMFWGNTATDAFMTPQVIRSIGNGTCRGGTVNKSGYWTPAILDGGDVMVPSRLQVYYKTGYEIGIPGDRNNELVEPVPAGFAMIANKTNSTYDISCDGIRDTKFFPCTTIVRISIQFPQCWDGVNLYSNTQAHVARAKRIYYSTNGIGCPATHLHALPAISYIIDIPVPEGRNAATWKLSSDKDTDIPGTTMHADYMNGWRQDLPVRWTKEILNQGLDGGSHHAGGGEMWY